MVVKVGRGSLTEKEHSYLGLCLFCGKQRSGELDAWCWGQRRYVYEEGHWLEGRQPAFVMTPFWQQPDQAMMAERDPGHGVQDRIMALVHPYQVRRYIQHHLGTLGLMLVVKL